MIRRWWPAALLLLAACSNGFWACGAREGVCCHVTPAVMRDATYVGSIPARDGGTEVKLVVTTDGNARVTFVRGGVEVVESFRAKVRR